MRRYGIQRVSELCRWDDFRKWRPKKIKSRFSRTPFVLSHVFITCFFQTVQKKKKSSKVDFPFFRLEASFFWNTETACRLCYLLIKIHCCITASSFVFTVLLVCHQQSHSKGQQRKFLVRMSRSGNNLSSWLMLVSEVKSILQGGIMQSRADLSTRAGVEWSSPWGSVLWPFTLFVKSGHLFERTELRAHNTECTTWKTVQITHIPR